MQRQVWSPTRIKDALQCGRRLQGKEEGWPKVENVRGVRGRAVHAAIQAWEESDRDLDLVDTVVEAWFDIFSESLPEGFEAEAILKPVYALWKVEAEIAFNENLVVAELSDSYKRPRQTKEFEKRTAHLDEARDEAAFNRHQIEELIEVVEWPWIMEKGLLAEGLDHSLETVRRGAEYLIGRWPTPDIIGSEWELTSTLSNGYRVRGFIDRVEASSGIEVVDYKSSEYQDTDLDHWLQAAVYSVIAEDHMGFPAERVRLVYLRDRKSVAFDVHPSWRDTLATLVAAADNVLETKSFAPTFSGCGICGFLPICLAEFALTPTVEEVTTP